MDGELVKVQCGGCGQEIALPSGTRSGEVIECACAHCAGLSLRVSEQGGAWSAEVLKTASCAVGEETVILPDDIEPGAVIECHGALQRVSYEFGAYALERV
ncbi:MAG: hypothetical protein L0191_18780 [Acidobacteria bacterium]|nr:hypothetical protein [Acidobacteriota bacterium]